MHAKKQTKQKNKHVMWPTTTSTCRIHAAIAVFTHTHTRSLNIIVLYVSTVLRLSIIFWKFLLNSIINFPSILCECLPSGSTNAINELRHSDLISHFIKKRMCDNGAAVCATYSKMFLRQQNSNFVEIIKFMSLIFRIVYLYTNTLNVEMLFCAVHFGPMHNGVYDFWAA